MEVRKVKRLHAFCGCLLLCGLHFWMPTQKAKGFDGRTVKVLTLEDGVPFTMGQTNSWRIIYPAMGAKKFTFNYVQSYPGDEFPQHVHGSSDDTFLILRGEVDVRQGDVRRKLPTGHAAFVPGGQIHGTITTGNGEAIAISFQAPPDYRLYTGERDSSKSGTEAPKGIITPGAVQLMEFQNKDGEFVHPGMGSNRISVSHRKLKVNGEFIAEFPNDGEGLLFVWQGAISVRDRSRTFSVAEKALLFAAQAGSLRVTNAGPKEATVIEIKSLPSWAE